MLQLNEYQGVERMLHLNEYQGAERMLQDSNTLVGTHDLWPL